MKLSRAPTARSSSVIAAVVRYSAHLVRGKLAVCICWPTRGVQDAQTVSVEWFAITRFF